MSELGRCLVTGGAGYLGRHLARELVRRGHPVRVLDVRPPALEGLGVETHLGDVRRPDDVRHACAGVDTVFHAAAAFCFATLATAAERAEAHAVNVGGTATLLEACRAAGVARVVHTSSNNVTFDLPVIDGDETRPYARRARDLYTRTKIEGERLALAANGRGGLLTCALRPGGIYGPGERLMLGPLLEACEAGFFVRVGDGRALSDNVYIDNLVDAQIQAARHLTPGSPVCGQAYFVSDGVPENYFAFFRPLVEGAGYRFPRLRLPAAVALGLAWAAEAGHRLVGGPEPFLTHHEVRKITVSHYNRIDKARRDFGWVPPVKPHEARIRTVEWCRVLREEIRARRGGAGRGPRRR